MHHNTLVQCSRLATTWIRYEVLNQIWNELLSLVLPFTLSFTYSLAHSLCTLDEMLLSNVLRLISILRAMAKHACNVLLGNVLHVACAYKNRLGAVLPKLNGSALGLLFSIYLIYLSLLGVLIDFRFAVV